MFYKVKVLNKVVTLDKECKASPRQILGDTWFGIIKIGFVPCSTYLLPTTACLPTYLLKKNTNHAHSQDLGCRLNNLNLVKLWVYVCMHDGMNNRVRIEIFLIHTVTFTLKYFITMYATVLI